MKNKGLKIVIAIVLMFILIIAGGILWYNMQLGAVNKESTEKINVEIEAGNGKEKIVSILYDKGLIKNEIAAKVYIKLNNIKNLQAGKYELSPNMNLEQILKELSLGNVIEEQVTITFLEGKNMRWIAKKIEEQTNNTEKQVYELLEDAQYINELIDKYWFLTEEITNEEIYYSLEGYLYPDTYNFENKDVTVKNIIEILLDQTEKVLNKYKDDIEKTGGSVHQILTLGSIVELEGNNINERAGIANVMYNRLKKNMSLGSDVTTYYAVKVDMGERDLYSSEINTYNPYNTRGPNMSGKLPIGPIASVSEESIKAVLNPEDENYLYFVADINGKIYFTSSYAEHQKVIKDLKSQGLWYEY